MKRREFIWLLGGAMAARPLAARAQQTERARRIGVLMPLTADDPQSQARIAAFRQALQQLGWTDGGNVRIETRWSAGNAADTRKYVAELVALAPDVILATGSDTMDPLLQTTHTVPIVFVLVPDPVGDGLVGSLARPGGNVTGFASFDRILSGKYLELLKEIAPRVMRAAVLRDPGLTTGIGAFAAIQSSAQSITVDVSPVDVRAASEIERAVTAFAREPNGGLIVTGSASAVVHQNPMALLPHQSPAAALVHYLPTRFRALALFGRRSPERVVRSSLPAAENLHRKRHHTP